MLRRASMNWTSLATGVSCLSKRLSGSKRRDSLRALEQIKTRIKQMSWRKFLAVAFHLFAVCMFIFAVVYDNIYLNERPTLKVGFQTRFMYLTNINMYLQVCYYAMCVLYDVIELIGWNHVKMETYQRLRDWFFASLVFPTGSFVPLTFWLLLSMYKDMVWIKELERVIPPWMNHLDHTASLVCAVIEAGLVAHSFPTRKKGISSTLVLMSSYNTWVVLIYFCTGAWIYPVFTQLSWVGRFGSFVTMHLLGVTLYLFGEKTTNLLWRRGESSTHDKIK